jgi:predicted enzyme related to lactoylglutathione lyase
MAGWSFPPGAATSPCIVPPPLPGRGRSPAKIVFAVKDVHGARERFAANGLKFGKVHEVNGFAFANARDPEGNPIQISSRGL